MLCYFTAPIFKCTCMPGTHLRRISLLLLQPQLPQCRSIFGPTSSRKPSLTSASLASTADGLINEPDQAQGFVQDVQRGIVVTILWEQVIGTGRILAEKHPIGQLHAFPFPVARVAGLTRGKEASHLDHLPTTLLNFAREQGQELA